jgi:hypothetical protein
LDELARFSSEFSPPMDGDRTNPHGFFWANPMFSTCDAMAYYCMIRRNQPETVLEVGSGFSSLVALEALRANGHGRLVCIEPYPREFLKHLGGKQLELLCQPVEQVPAAFFQKTLRDGDLLFIDSTHTVRTGNDCAHLFLRVLPMLDVALDVHVHDIFLPLGYPQMWLLQLQQYWNEQYLLHALLTDNPRAQVLYGTVYHRIVNPQRLEAFMGGKFPISGSSFWFHLNAQTNRRKPTGQFDQVEANLQQYLAEDSTEPLAARAASIIPPVSPEIKPRNARRPIPAIEFDAQFGIRRFDKHIGSLDHGDWVRYPRIDFGNGANRAHLTLAAPPHKAGQTIELHTDALDGPVIAIIQVTSTGSWDEFATQSSDITPITGIHDLYLSFRGYYGIANLREIQFD